MTVIELRGSGGVKRVSSVKVYLVALRNGAHL